MASPFYRGCRASFVFCDRISGGRVARVAAVRGHIWGASQAVNNDFAFFVTVARIAAQTSRISHPGPLAQAYS